MSKPRLKKLTDKQHEILKTLVYDGSDLYIPGGEPTQEAIDEMYDLVKIINEESSGFFYLVED